MLGISQGQLGNLVGRSAQQIHKYQNGADEIVASSLFALGQAPKPTADPPIVCLWHFWTRRDAWLESTMRSNPDVD